TAQYHTGVFPSDGGTGFHLSPGYMRTVAATFTALRDEVVDTALPVLVSWVPVLHCGVLHLGIFKGNNLNHRSVQLVLIAHGRGTAFQITDVSALVRN